jgi:hypothetical protein
VLLALAGCGGSDDTDTSPTAAGVAGVVEAANTFLGTLSSDQKAQAQLQLTKDNATAWSNLPCGSSCRVGVEFSTLNDKQLTAGKNVLKAAMGTSTGAGYDQAMKILLADDYLGSVQGSGGGTGGPGAGPSGGMGGTPPSGGGSGGPPSGGTGGQPGGGGGGGGGYSSGTYFLAMLGTPTVDGTWQLHFGGHHLAVNLTYKNGKVAGSTPFFIGVEPTSWTASNGEKYAPLDIMRDGMLKLTTSLSADQLAKAKLSQSFNDVLLGPDKDGQFPATKEGIAVSSLSEAQKTLVMDAVRPWVAVVDDATAEALMNVYKSELDQTYVSYSGGTGLTTQGDYVRIDGPSVWVEFVCQNGLVIQNQVHYHTIYRDHTRDYGGEFSF